MQRSALVDAYIRDNHKDARRILGKIRDSIRSIVPEATETITYGIPTFDLGGKHLVHFAAFKKHVGFYPTPSAITAFKKELSRYRSAKGSVQFPFSEPIPYELITNIVLFRVKETSKKK